MMIKLKGFTVLELVVAMLLGGVVISISFYAFAGFNHKFRQVFNRSGELSEFRLFEKILNHDIGSSIAIGREEDRLLFYFSEALRVEYKFEDNNVTRISDNAETRFNLNSHLEDVGYFGNSLLINSILIRINIFNDSTDFQLFKEYTPVDLLHSKNVFND